MFGTTWKNRDVDGSVLPAVQEALVGLSSRLSSRLSDLRAEPVYMTTTWEAPYDNDNYKHDTITHKCVRACTYIA